MNRKNPFVKWLVVLVAGICFFVTSCGSGYREEGEVSFTFTQPVLQQIFARGAETGGYDFNQFSSMNMGDEDTLSYVGFINNNISYANDYLLMLFDNNSYRVYDTSKMLGDASGLIEQNQYPSYGSGSPDTTIDDIDGLDELSGLGNFSNLMNDPYSLYDSAAISKGTWTQSGNSISITETHYLDSASGTLKEVSNPSVIATVSTNEHTFTVTSNAGVSLTFYDEEGMSNINPYGGDIWNGEGNGEGNKEENNQNNQNNKPSPAKLSVELKAGGRTYDKDIEIVEVEVGLFGKLEGDTNDSVYVLFAYSDGKFVIQNFKNNIFSAEVADGKWDFVTEREIKATVNGSEQALTIRYDGNKVEDFKYETKDGKYITFSEEYTNKEFIDNYKFLPVTVSFKKLPVGAKGKVKANITYMGMEVANGESDSFTIAEYSTVNVKMRVNTRNVKKDDKNNGNSNNGGNNGSSEHGGSTIIEPEYSGWCYIPQEYEDKIPGYSLTFAAYPDKSYKILAYEHDASGNVKETIFAKGTWELKVSEDAETLKLTETDYYNFTSNKLVSGGNKTTEINLDDRRFEYNTSMPIELEFELNEKYYEYPFNISIKGIKGMSESDTRKVYITYIEDSTTMADINRILNGGDVISKEDTSKLQLMTDNINQITCVTASSYFNGVGQSAAYTCVINSEGTLDYTHNPLYLTIKPGKTVAIYVYVLNNEYQPEYFGMATPANLSTTSNNFGLNMKPVYKDPEYTAEGNISFDNNVLLMELERTTFNETNNTADITVKTKAGTTVDKYVDFKVELLYKGENLFKDNDPYPVSVQNNLTQKGYGQLTISDISNLPKGSYQLYINVRDAATDYFYYSQYFDIVIE